MNKHKEIIPIEDNRLYFLFKRGEHDHIKALFEEGEVYINSIDHIRKCDNNKERSDEEDGIFYRNFIGQATVTMCDVGKDFDNDGVNMNTPDLVFNYDHTEKGNIYCLTGIYSEHLSGDRDNITFNTKSFGETTILIHSPQNFLDRLFDALKENGYSNFKPRKVSYYENNYSGNVGFFRKHERFKPQSEFRIFIPNAKNEPIKLKIGSLKDIASFNTGFIKLNYTDGKEQIISL
ncbi:hypothetical protein [uncultured Acetobacteroides sp.]|uniref:hypothetical protein n=1 Tax=uncultured Acetobacteroides sp. TaxID=1760811 RepID=UPI0029F5695B|nr:hypothetical protein [uncultured Acetobacteroides sp.]